MFRPLLVAIGCALAWACSPGTDAEPPSRVVLSDSGSLRFELQTPSGVTRGANEIRMLVSRVDGGVPDDDLALEMVPFMPSMGHGSGIAPRLLHEGPGDYAFSDVVLNMAGRWQLRTSISGERSDYVVLEVDVP